MELCAELLRHRIVGGIADEDVSEAEAVITLERRPVRADELLANKGHQVSDESVARGLWQEFGHGAAVEASPLDGRPLDHLSLSELQSVDAGRQHVLHGRRQTKGKAGGHRRGRFETCPCICRD